MQVKRGAIRQYLHHDAILILATAEKAGCIMQGTRCQKGWHLQPLMMLFSSKGGPLFVNRPRVLS